MDRGLRRSIAGAVALAFALSQGCAVPQLGERKASGPRGDGGAPTEDAGAEPSAPAVRYIGRFDTSDESGPKVGWPGARVIIRFRGTTLKARTNETNIYRGPSRYDVSVDGSPLAKPFAPAAGTTDNVIVADLPEGEHVVELWRRTESMVSTTQFLGFDYGSGELLPPPAPAARHIEFVGDSSVTGYGSECTSKNQDFDGATSNEHRSYAAVTAKALDAEHHNISYSGKGVLRNYDNADPVVFAQLYVRTLAEDATSQWSFSWSADVVVIALGANDWNDTDGRQKPNSDNFKKKYHELVSLIRSKHPRAHIVCTVGSSITDVDPPGYNALTNVRAILKAVVDERRTAPYSDPKVYFHEPPRPAPEVDGNGNPDLSGCDGHSSAAHHAKLGADLTAKIKTIAGW